MLASQLLDTLPLIIREWRNEMDHGLPDGLSVGQFRIMWFIEDGNQQCGILSRRLGVSPAAMSKSIDVLVNAGYVQRKNSEVDRRNVQLILTRKGLTLFKRVRSRVEERMEKVLAILSAAEKKQVEAALQLMQKAFLSKR